MGFDPIELRRQNIMPKASLPLKTAMGLDVDCGDFLTVFEKTLAMSERAGFAARAAKSEENNKLRGFAIAPYLEWLGGMPKEHAIVTFSKMGRPTWRLADHSTGMGHETALCQDLVSRAGVGHGSH